VGQLERHTVDISKLIANARAKVAAPEYVDVEILVDETVVTVRFNAVDGPTWSHLTATHPARRGSALDVNLGGYNIDGVVEDYPLEHITLGPSADELARLDGEEDEARKTWKSLLTVLSGPDLRNLRVGIYGVNQLDPDNRREAAKKATAGEAEKKPSSPASSGSRRGASRGGNQPK
jgi:hypothetical protein